MPKVGKGVVPPAKFEDIIEDLYENEKIKNADGSKTIFTFSAARLTDQQKQSLTYPEGFTPLNVFVIYQTDDFDASNNLTQSNLSLISFTQKGDGFIYAHYFEVTSQERLDIDLLEDSNKPLPLSSAATFSYINYFEVYHDIKGTTVILGLDTEIPEASLQFATSSKYFYQAIDASGTIDPLIPETELTGLSDNLKKLKLHKNGEMGPSS